MGTEKATREVTFAVGCDPGACGALSMVRWSEIDKTASLLGTWPIYGRRTSLWFERCRHALEEIQICCERYHLDLSELRLGIEVPPRTSRMGSLSGDRRGQRTWFGLGKYAGRIEASWYTLGGRRCIDVAISTWTGCLKGQVRSHKMGKGKHRITEACTLLPEARAIFQDLPARVHIDSAESMLIALAIARAEAHAPLNPDLDDDDPLE